MKLRSELGCYNCQGMVMLCIMLTIIAIAYSYYRTHIDDYTTKLEKPAIYLYPTRTCDVKVNIQFAGHLTKTIPQFPWEVKAFPDGRILASSGKTYPYLFWEGKSNEFIPDFSKGFVVKSNDVETFLNDKLSEIGLSFKERKDFIDYWEPKMRKNQYNLVTFADREYTDIAPLKIDPVPDSVLRVFMVYKAIPEPIEIPEQELKPFERKGFTVVEWGGTEI